MPSRGAIGRKTSLREDKGFTLVELLISMTIFSILMALIFGLFITMLNQSNDNFARTRSVEQARLGISQIDRQVRSGNVILDPSLDGITEAGVPSNYSLRVYTQENGEDKCAQWRVIFDAPADKFGRLEFREWDAGDPSSTTNWSSVANNVEAPAGSFVSGDVTTYPPFWVDTTTATGTIDTKAQNIRITLRMGDPKSDPDAKPASVTSVVTGRNTVFGYSPDYCASIPSV
ncbi:PulJ/GspJ family protein [Demequina oxidasica]|uniref:PulJ/GspJ family protein n=1 Tax=Demequina oxidasica TaxID=676199 RepID=UPI00078648BF|nr:type II secretion system protein [Demequina oxidasica]